jgi:hypothetical protein
MTSFQSIAPADAIRTRVGIDYHRQATEIGSAPDDARHFARDIVDRD